MVVNEGVKGDEKGEFTFTGGGGMVIDLMLGNSEARKKIEKLRVGNRVKLDHQPWR